MKNFRSVVCILLFLLIVPLARAQNPYSRSFPLKVDGIDVGELVISFEDVIKVGSFSVNLAKTPLSPSGSVLPFGVLPVPIPLINSPLFVTIETTTSFRGPAHVSMRIFLLEYDPGIPFRLFCAQGTLKSPYRDITASAGKGSMYTTGYRKGFSEFLVALDLRDLSEVIFTKFTELNDVLESNARHIQRNKLNELRSYYWLSRDAWVRGNVANSIEHMESFVAAVRDGAVRKQIPNSHNDPRNSAGNVAGELIAGAKTLLFSLKLVP